MIRKLDIACFELGKAFGVVSYSLLITIPLWYQLDNWNIRWVETWLLKGL